jgi:hypothetical protein
VVVSGEFVAEDYSLFSKLKRSDHEFNDELEALVTGWLITQDRDFCEHGSQIFVPSHDGGVSVLAMVKCKCSGKAAK